MGDLEQILGELAENPENREAMVFAGAQRSYEQYKETKDPRVLETVHACAKALVEAAPQNAQYHNLYGRVLRHQGKLSEACGEFRIALTGEPGNTDFAYNLAVALNQQGNPREAVDILCHGDSSLPNLELAARIEHTGNRFEEAAAIYHCITVRFPTSFNGWYGSGILAYRRQDFHTAQTMFARAQELIEQASAKNRKDLKGLIRTIESRAIAR